MLENLNSSSQQLQGNIYASVRPPRIIRNSSKDLEGIDDSSQSASFAMKPSRASSRSTSAHNRSRSNNSRSSSGYLAPTASSLSRKKKGLNLREKLFELHEAVREMQGPNHSKTNNSQSSWSNPKLQSSSNNVLKTGQSNSSVNTQELQNQTVDDRLCYLEEQMYVYKQAMGTLADAISEEFDSSKKLPSELQSQVQVLKSKLEQFDSQQQKHDSEQATMQNQISKMRDAIKHQLAAPSPADFDQDFTSIDEFKQFKENSKRLFEQLRGLVQQVSKQSAITKQELQKFDAQLDQVRTSTIETQQNITANMSQYQYQNHHQNSVSVETAEFQRRIGQLERDFNYSKCQSLSQSDLVEINHSQKQAQLEIRSLQAKVEALTQTIVEQKRLLDNNQREKSERHKQTPDISTTHLEAIEIQLKKFATEVQEGVKSSKELTKSVQQNLQTRIEFLEENKDRLESARGHRQQNIQDLFETQRRELYTRMNELEKNMTSKFLKLQRKVIHVAENAHVDIDDIN